MKKKLILALSLALVAVAAFALQKNNEKGLFNENVSVLRETKEGIWGKCRGESNSCLWICPICKAKYEAAGLGESYNVSGACIVCGYVVVP